MNIFDDFDLLLSIENINFYPFNLNNNINDNIIETKKEIELEYIQHFLKPIFIESGKKNIKGAQESTIFIF
jgi:hypothetical protein